MLKYKSRPILIMLLLIVAIVSVFALSATESAYATNYTKYITPTQAKTICSKIESNLMNRSITYGVGDWEKAKPSTLVCCTVGAWAYYYALPTYCKVELKQPSVNSIGNVHYCPNWDREFREFSRIYSSQKQSNFAKGDCVLFYNAAGTCTHLAIWKGI